VSVGSGFRLTPGSRIRARTGRIGNGVRIGARTRLICEDLRLDDGVTIGDDVEIVAGSLVLGRGARIGTDVRITAVDGFSLGRFSVLGARSRLTGRRMVIGEFLWAVGDLSIGGGGALGPGATLQIGDRCTLVDRVFINLADAVVLGNDVALSYGVTVLTHGAWQPVLDGYDAAFGPVTIGDNAVVYTQTTILPGVTIGAGATIGSVSLVNRDIPRRTFAAGVPARVIRTARQYPRRLTAASRNDVVLGILRDYLATLDYKGYRVVTNDLRRRGTAVVQVPGEVAIR